MDSEKMICNNNFVCRTMDQIHRRKSVIHMEMQNNNNKNILLEEL